MWKCPTCCVTNYVTHNFLYLYPKSMLCLHNCNSSCFLLSFAVPQRGICSVAVKTAAYILEVLQDNNITFKMSSIPQKLNRRQTDSGSFLYRKASRWIRCSPFVSEQSWQGINMFLNSHRIQGLKDYTAFLFIVTVHVSIVWTHFNAAHHVLAW